MRPTLFSVSSSAQREQGHTLLELMVSMGLTLVVAAMVSVGLKAQMDVYLTDVGRKRIQQNLRSAMDIVAMNIRQAGEGFDGQFPAVLLESDEETEKSVLTLRRKILHEVQLVCSALNVGETKIYVSDVTATGAECMPVNIADMLDAWRTQRLALDGSIRIYIYDRVSIEGEYLDYTGEGSDGQGDYLTVSSVDRAYPAGATSIYVIEEYKFSLDTETSTLQLRVDGSTDTPDDVAYNITDFQVTLRMQDDTVLNSLQADDGVSWQDLRAVGLTLSGEETWRNTTVQRSVSAEYFPRNVMSK